MLESIPDAEKIEFKEKFIERYSQLTDFEAFKKYSLSFLRRSIRVNTLKISVNDLKKRLKNWKLTQIPWCQNGFYIEGERRDIGNLPEHSLGYIYVQESVSMVPPLALNPKPHELVLDIAASPGSKTTQLAAMMKNQGLLVANDHKYERIKPLSINLERCGVSNCIITLSKGQAFKNFKFDKILVDAPCSATGTIRRSLKTITMWNPNMIKRLAKVQKSLILTAYNNLKDKGTLVYSTCSLEPEENEGVVNFLLDRYTCKIEKIKLKIKSSPPILKFQNKEYNKEIENCLRIWPQDNNTEGFFIAKIKKH